MLKFKSKVPKNYVHDAKTIFDPTFKISLCHKMHFLFIKKRKYLFDFLFSSFLFSIFSFYNDSIFCRVKTTVIRYFFLVILVSLVIQKYDMVVHFHSVHTFFAINFWMLSGGQRTHITYISPKRRHFLFHLHPPDLKIKFFLEK